VGWRHRGEDGRRAGNRRWLRTGGRGSGRAHWPSRCAPARIRAGCARLLQGAAWLRRAARRLAGNSPGYARRGSYPWSYPARAETAFRCFSSAGSGPRKQPPRPTCRNGRGGDRTRRSRPPPRQIGGAPSQHDGEADHRNIHVPVGACLSADLHQSDYRRQRHQEPEPAGGQVGSATKRSQRERRDDGDCQPGSHYYPPFKAGRIRIEHRQPDGQIVLRQ